MVQTAAKSVTSWLTELIMNSRSPVQLRSSADNESHCLHVPMDRGLINVKCQIKFVERIDHNNTPGAMNALMIRKSAVFSCHLKESKLSAGSRRPSGSEFQ